jgi:RHS repeat-associated protein
LGDVVALKDSNGKVVNRYSYDVWGNLTSSQETVENPIRSRGEYYDSESGFYYLRGRYYDPNARRFTTSDPAEDGLNWDAYCGNNPWNYVDPSGYVRVYSSPVNIPIGDEMGVAIDAYFSDMELFSAMGVAKEPSKAREIAETIVSYAAGYLPVVGRAFDAANCMKDIANVFSKGGIPELVLEAGQNDQLGKYDKAGLVVSIRLSLFGTVKHAKGVLISKETVKNAAELSRLGKLTKSSAF